MTILLLAHQCRFYYESICGYLKEESMDVPQPSSFPLRMPADLRSALQEKADRLDRSLHWVIVKTLEDARRKEQRTKAEAR